jgi:hypothetical protein
VHLAYRKIIGETEPDQSAALIGSVVDKRYRSIVLTLLRSIRQVSVASSHLRLRCCAVSDRQERRSPHCTCIGSLRRPIQRDKETSAIPSLAAALLRLRESRIATSRSVAFLMSGKVDAECAFTHA